ncbi:hypothetical protein DFH09DRAFT_1326778 [Mycena vulgaris]|nr:hypothetical protein DFH09DRAFT_1326778 [Mycena vulgaris]
MDPTYQDLIFQEILDFERDTERRQRPCEGCGESPGAYCCRNCLWSPVLCTQCIVQHHEGLPLHRIEVVDGGTAKETSLKLMGLRIQLGHGTAGFCPNPVLDDDFCIHDTQGAHDVNLTYCGCDLAPPRGQQLMDARFYPLPWGGRKTWTNPHCAVTFEVARCDQDRIAERIPRVRPKKLVGKGASGSRP